MRRTNAMLFVSGVAVAACHGATTTPSSAGDGAPPALILSGVLEPPAPSGNECVYTSDPTAPMLSRGLVDCALTQTYTPTFLVGNSGVAAEIQQAVVQVVDPETNGVVTDHTELGSAAEFAASGSEPSYATVSFTLMNDVAMSRFCPEEAGAGNKKALVQVAVYGQTLAGASVGSNTLLFEVDVCYGCLVSAPASAPAGYCKGIVPDESVAVACVTGQDQVTDCQLCSATVAYCANLK
jgi:hypothetical protein